MAIRVVLVDDHMIIRDGLSSLLARENDIEVVGEAENGRDGVQLATQLRPEVVIMDIGMQDLNGIDATRRLLDSAPATSVIALSMHSDSTNVTAMLAAGAKGYLVKENAFEELVEAIRAVVDGRVYLSHNIAGVVVEDLVRRMGQPGETPGPAPQLSSREREVLQLIAEGNSTKEIAACLHLSVKTVEAHRRQIMERLEIFTVAGLVKYAVKQGLVSLEG